MIERLTAELTGVVAKPDLSITEADRGYNVRVECEVRRWGMDTRF